MQRIIVLAVLIVLLFSQGAFAAMGLQDMVAEHQLDNGATVLLVERHNSPTIAAYISFKVGGANETSEERGVAHLLEHMLFKGTKTLGTTNYPAEKILLEKIKTVGQQIDVLKNLPNVPTEQLQKFQKDLAELQQQQQKLVVKNEFSRIYAQNGGVGYNAFTSKDLTTYLINLPANKLELWANIEADRLENAVFREFYTERDVVHEERRRSYESSPDGLLYETLLATAYKVHPYRNPVIGWSSDIDKLDPDQIRTFFNKYYTPTNMVITLVGDFDSATTLPMINRYFGKLKPGVPVPTISTREPEQQGERRATVKFDAEPQMLIAFHKPTLPHRDDYVFDLIMQILTSGRTSRLYKALVLDKKLVTHVDTYGAPGSRYDNLMVLAAVPHNGISFAQVEEAIYAELERLQTEPITQLELDTASKQILTSIMRGLKGNSGLAGSLSSYETLGDWRYLVNYESELKTIVPQDIMDVAKRYLKADNRTVVTLQRGEK